MVMPEVQDIFNLYGDDYRKSHGLSLIQHKAMAAIQTCRTAELGAHMDACESCGCVDISYNSCRNRHCPKCQTLAKERWIDSQKHDLLNVGYFHVVFTVPDDLRPIIYQNQSVLYSLLFHFLLIFEYHLRILQSLILLLPIPYQVHLT